MMMKQLSGFSGSWVLALEHTALRVISLGCSLASAYAIRLVLSPLEGLDFGEGVFTWIIAACFGVGGYIASRGLVHRMMHKQSIVWYLPVFLVVEFMDIGSNYMLAASAIGRASMLATVPQNQESLLTVLMYGLLTAVALMSLCLAVVDMDLERKKQGIVGMGGGVSKVPRSTQVPARPGQPGVPVVPSSLVRPNGSGNAAQGARPLSVADGIRQREFLEKQRQQKPGIQVSAKDLRDDPDKVVAV
jgi:hypothetical protein